MRPGIDWAYDPAIGLGDLASSEAARYTTDRKDPMHRSWNQVVHKKAAYVRAVIATGLDVLVCAHQLQRPPFSAHHNIYQLFYVCLY